MCTPKEFLKPVKEKYSRSIFEFEKYKWSQIKSF